MDKESSFRPVSTRPRTSMDNSDARSVYSVNSRADDTDDTMSVASGYSRGTYRDDVDAGASTVDTLVHHLKITTNILLLNSPFHQNLS